MLFLLGSLQGLLGQNIDADRERADKLFEVGHFEQAIKYYGYVLQQGYDADVCARMATSHFARGEYLDAEYWYGQAVASDGLDPVHFRSYAEVLRANGKLEESRSWFEKYDRYALDVGFWKPSFKLQEELEKGKPAYRVAAVDLNTSASEIAPAFYGEAVVFASNRKSRGWNRTSSSSGQPYYDLYLSYADDGQRFDPPALLRGGVNSPWDDAGFAIDPATGTVWLTRNASRGWKRLKDGEGTVRPAIYQARVRGNKIGKAKRFSDFGLDASYAHPNLSLDGNRLYFASDREGGQGGMDIWYIDRNSEGWSDPVNMGPEINTGGNELFPYIAGENRFYFSSDGHPGLGGLDLFQATEVSGRWGVVSNLGIPMNSARDDFGLISRNNQGYFCSDRLGGMGRDDIYAFERVSVGLNVSVYHAETGQPISGAEIEWIVGEGPEGNQQSKTNTQGESEIELAPGKNFYLIVRKGGFQDYIVSETRNRERFSILLQQDLPPELDQVSQQADPEEEVHISAADQPVYRIRIGCYRNPDRARLNDLAAFGNIIEEKEGELTLIYVGSWSSREEAANILPYVTASGFSDAFIEQSDP